MGTFSLKVAIWSSQGHELGRALLGPTQSTNGEDGAVECVPRGSTALWDPDNVGTFGWLIVLP